MGRVVRRVIPFLILLMSQGFIPLLAQEPPDPTDPAAATDPHAAYWKWIVMIGTAGILELLPGDSLSQEAWHSALALRLALVAFLVTAAGHIFLGWWK